MGGEQLSTLHRETELGGGSKIGMGSQMENDGDGEYDGEYDHI